MVQTKAAFDAREIASTPNQHHVLRIIRGYGGAWVTDEQIARDLERKPSFERAVRQAIHELRKKGVPVCHESGRGYRWPAELLEVKATVYDLRARAKDMYDTANKVWSGAVAMFGEQDMMDFENGNIDIDENLVPDIELEVE